MALFKIEKGLSSGLATARPNTNEGWCYFTTDDGKFYIDIDTKTGDTSGRIVLNAGAADKLTCGNIGAANTPVYFQDGVPVACETMEVNGYLPLSAGEENKISGPLGFDTIMYGTELPDEPFEGQLFFLEDESSGTFLPTGGETGQVLIKNSEQDGDASWGEIVALPEGGSQGQALIKNSNIKGDASWQDVVALPKGGSAGQALIKVSAEDGDAEWKEIVALPKGGAQGQILTKSSSTDGDAAWQNFPELNYLPLTGGNLTGELNSIGLGNGSANFRAVGGGYGFLIRNDGESTWFLLSDTDNGLGTFNDLRPLRIKHSDGTVTCGTKLYGAVYNDYAEFRDQKEFIEPGYCVASADNGQVYKTTEKFQACDGIVSDTFGFAIGETDKCKTPLAVAGRVLAYCEGDRYDYHSGDTVCAGPDGKVCKMTREEIREWPDRIIGIVSEIPEYETWGTGNTVVNNRIWIKIK